MVEENVNDSNHEPLQDNLRLLNQMKLKDGRPLIVIPIQMPGPLYWNGQRLPASYANFYICNAAVIVPTYNDPQDEKALRTIGQLFPDRPTLGIDSTHLIGGLGSFHCLSQQQPAML
jgi:agmatine deiminase